MTPEQARLAALKIAHRAISSWYNDPPDYLLYAIIDHGGVGRDGDDQKLVLDQMMEIMDRLWREYHELKEQDNSQEVTGWKK